jgi:hypothetical protein
VAIFDLFSKRNKPAPDVFLYHELPSKLRAQVVHILRDTISGVDSDQFWQWLGRTIAYEHGLLDIPETPSRYPYNFRDWKIDCLNYFLQASTEHALDVVQLCFQFIANAVDSTDYTLVRVIDNKKAVEALSDLNVKLRENACGYQFETSPRRQDNSSRRLDKDGNTRSACVA